MQSETNETPETQGTDPAASSEPAGEASATSEASTAAMETATQAEGPAQPNTMREIEDSLRDAGNNLEAAAKDLGAKLDAKLTGSETGREVKQKLGGFFRKIQDTIK